MFTVKVRFLLLLPSGALVCQHSRGDKAKSIRSNPMIFCSLAEVCMHVMYACFLFYRVHGETFPALFKLLRLLLTVAVNCLTDTDNECNQHLLTQHRSFIFTSCLFTSIRLSMTLEIMSISGEDRFLTTLTTGKMRRDTT